MNNGMKTMRNAAQAITLHSESILNIFTSAKALPATSINWKVAMTSLMCSTGCHMTATLGKTKKVTKNVKKTVHTIGQALTMAVGPTGQSEASRMNPGRKIASSSKQPPFRCPRSCSAPRGMQGLQEGVVPNAATDDRNHSEGHKRQQNVDHRHCDPAVAKRHTNNAGQNTREALANHEGRYRACVEGPRQAENCALQEGAASADQDDEKESDRHGVVVVDIPQEEIAAHQSEGSDGGENAAQMHAERQRHLLGHRPARGKDENQVDRDGIRSGRPAAPSFTEPLHVLAHALHEDRHEAQDCVPNKQGYHAQVVEKDHNVARGPLEERLR
eukprot:CAMPEP_0170284154 /NCGR_PEP_ID=MMETSP0116_2-20130129/42114_1 /TAXON_ID=400756 /ORGANISM="Durinskia baltica, Strain CSIRO CS-38" /LENGTH=329 /DNA_ID=CAMNT_0010535531 /DNA_START=746 /DNA_END=1734 /DNA_ORIENTATION=-